MLNAPSDPVSPPGEGDPAPPFTLPCADNTTLSLADFAVAKLVLFMFPRADTPGCTTEAQDFSRLEPAFAAAGTRVVGLSADPPRKLARFRDRRELNVLLLSDETHGVLDAYGAWGEKVLYGKRFEGVLRSTFLIGRDGRIARLWRNVKVPAHAAEVLAAAQKSA